MAPQGQKMHNRLDEGVKSNKTMEVWIVQLKLLQINKDQKVGRTTKPFSKCKKGLCRFLYKKITQEPMIP
jgi:hypothetical protein